MNFALSFNQWFIQIHLFIAKMATEKWKIGLRATKITNEKMVLFNKKFSQFRWLDDVFQCKTKRFEKQCTIDVWLIYGRVATQNKSTTNV